jgi:hypothetical protein
VYDDNGDKNNQRTFRNSLFEEYPQLLPFSGLQMEMKLNTSGVDDAVTREVISGLKDCEIKWVSDNDGVAAPTVFISFIKKASAYEADISVTAPSGKTVVSNQRLIFKQAKGAGGEIGLRLFGKGGALVFDPPQAQGR